MMVQAGFEADLRPQGEVKLPPESALAAEPLARLIVVEVPTALAGVASSPEPAETIDLPGSRLLVFRRDLYQEERFEVTLRF